MIQSARTSRVATNGVVRARKVDIGMHKPTGLKNRYAAAQNPASLNRFHLVES